MIFLFYFVERPPLVFTFLAVPRGVSPFYSRVSSNQGGGLSTPLNRFNLALIPQVPPAAGSRRNAFILALTLILDILNPLYLVINVQASFTVSIFYYLRDAPTGVAHDAVSSSSPTF